jgi:hypothetical protein
MRDWIVILVLYVFVLGLFRVLGGFAAAGEAIQAWGRATSRIRTKPGSGS